MRNTRMDEVLAGKESNYLLPFYWQHGNHTERIPAQIQRIYDSGARALCVESRPHNDFCGEGWWRDMDIIIRECKARDMKVWILDDDHFPTGHANGGIERRPELAQRVARERHVDVVGPMQDASFIVKLPRPDDVLLGVYALRRNNDEGQTCCGDPVNLNEMVKGDWLYWSVPEGTWRVFIYYETFKGGKKNYIDMINRDSVRVLIDEVYETHWAHYADEFGKTIAGFFSDEPSFGNETEGAGWSDTYESWIGQKDMTLPWNARVLGLMKETLGYDPMPHLHALWYEDVKRAEMRFAYMDAVTRLYDECFTSQLGDWCRQHGVEYIGHIIEDMHAHSRLGCSAGHFFRSLRSQDMSGIDVVLHQIIPGMTDTIHSASVADNKADPEFFDYVLAKLGASLAHLTPHMQGRAMCEIFGAYGWAEDSVMQKRLMDHMLVRGINYYVPHAFSPEFPDPDCPPHFGAEGMDPSFEAFTTLMKYTNKVCHMLYGGTHIASAAILYDAEGEWCSRCGTSMPMQKPAKALYDSLLDYDIVCMDMLLQAKVEDNKLRINEESFGCLIVPGADHLPDALVSVMARFAAEGLPVLFVERAPENLSFDGRIVSLADLPSELEALKLRNIASEQHCPHLRAYHMRREGSDVFFFVNEDANAVADTNVLLPAVGKYARLDLLNDCCVSGCSSDGKVHLNLLPGQSQLIVFADNELPPEYEVAPIHSISPEFELDLAECDKLDVFTRWMRGSEFFNVTGPKGKPGFSGKMRYRFSFEVKAGERLFMNLGSVGQNATLSINGSDCGIRICPPYRYEITAAVKDGENIAEVIVSNTLVQREPDVFSTYLPVAPSGLLGPVTIEKGI